LHCVGELREILNDILQYRFDKLSNIIKTIPRKKMSNCLLTHEEVIILALNKILGIKPDSIASILNMSRSNVYATLKRIRQKMSILRNTIRIYDAISNPIIINISRGDTLPVIIDKIFSEADKRNIKLPYRSIEVADILRREGVINDNDAIGDHRLIIIPGLGIYVEKKT
jgi:Tfx family DNA-binding protein